MRFGGKRGKYNQFDFFINEINKYSDGVHSLNPGAELRAVEKLEEEMGIKFPQKYKSFLQIYNGGELFVPGTVLARICTDGKENENNGTLYLNKKCFDDLLPDSLMIIAVMNYGDLICIEVSRHTRPDSKVVQWSHDEAAVSRTWSGLCEWLLDTLEEGKLLVEYDGSEKELAL